MSKHNLNDYVTVTLTDIGRKMLVRDCAKYDQRPSDDEWAGKFQMWRLFEIYGSYINQATQVPPFKHNTIEFESPESVDHRPFPERLTDKFSSVFMDWDECTDVWHICASYSRVVQEDCDHKIHTSDAGERDETLEETAERLLSDSEGYRIR